MAGPQKATKNARQVANLPGEEMMYSDSYLHSIVHTYRRIYPAEG